MSFARTRDLLRLAEMAAARRGGVSLEDICSEFGVSHRTAQRMLMQNRYVFNPFWQHHNDIDGFEDWEARFAASSRSFAQAFQAGDGVRVLSFVFDRLYVLRNQLVHGGSTWNGGVNRAQVRDGAAILAFLMPVFVDLMMDNPQEDWGRPFYPVVA